ncbi:hypothetical protein V6N13_071326 [Hibiscus sabdariffa]|uniref:Uncharacterized protein n=1 Tax=Hibiscus sabdariffa TaxID=183260 RepID=A0ABR2TEI3_9ROSI
MERWYSMRIRWGVHQCRVAEAQTTQTLVSSREHRGAGFIGKWALGAGVRSRCAGAVGAQGCGGEITTRAECAMQIASQPTGVCERRSVHEGRVCCMV